MIDYIASIILLFVAFIANGVMDLLSFHWHKSPKWMKKRWEFWNPSYSWMNKWKDDTPTQGERFFGSTTVFVFVTDGWHLCKEIMITSICIAFTIPVEITVEEYAIPKVLVFIVYRFVCYFGFKISYR